MKTPTITEAASASINATAGPQRDTEIQKAPGPTITRVIVYVLCVGAVSVYCESNGISLVQRPQWLGLAALLIACFELVLGEVRNRRYDRLGQVEHAQWQHDGDS